MAVETVQVEGVAGATYKSVKDVADFVIAVKKLGDDGWQPGEDLPAAFQALLKEVTEIFKRYPEVLAEFALGDKQALVKAVGLGALDFGELLDGGE